MKNLFFFLLILATGYGCSTKSPERLIDYVNPMIGTDATGHTYPGAVSPFGMVQLSPDTKLVGWEGCSGYHFQDTILYGFSHTHLSGTGCEDYCDILVMPTTGNIQWENKDYLSAFRHSSEKASVGYYAVTLDKYDIQAELTTSPRVGLHRYTFPEQAQANILFDLKHRGTVLQSSLQVVSNTEICGYRRVRQWANDRQIYFAAQFSEPFTQSELQDSTKAALTFEAKTVLVKVALSSVSVENARENLNTEMSDWDFNKVKANVEQAWENQLSKIIVEGGSQAERTNFYTALYHTSIVPNLYMDVNGEYRGRFGKVGHADFDNYTLFSLWDTYRGAHPLYSIINPKRNQDFIKSFIRLYEEGGLLPVWELAGNETFCMIGHHAVSVITDAYMKGYRDFDVEKAYEACKKSADTALFGLPYFIQNGYVPQDKERESVSKTLEYAYDAWCIAQMAKEMGQTADYETYIRRAQYYKNTYDQSTGFMRAKVNGTWYSPFDPFEVNNNYTEANAWQYSFYVPQDIDGLAQLHGGKEALAAKIDEMFAASDKTTGRNQADIT
ncbi:MAG: GH92 family glycosyl hydrolase, partial [Bacteroidales bacterium]|nr:GH92 family glycosyl hydrolase [Bacteroidales bacterium]